MLGSRVRGGCSAVGLLLRLMGRKNKVMGSGDGCGMRLEGMVVVGILGRNIIVGG